MLGSPPAEAGARPGRARPAVQWSDSDSDRAPPQPPPQPAKGAKRPAQRFAEGLDSDSDSGDVLDLPSRGRPGLASKPKAPASRRSVDSSHNTSSSRALADDEMAAALDMFDRPAAPTAGSQSSRPRGWK